MHDDFFVLWVHLKRSNQSYIVLKLAVSVTTKTNFAHISLLIVMKLYMMNVYHMKLCMENLFAGGIILRG